MDPQMQAWFDQQDAHHAEMIRRFGWFIPYIGGGCNRPGCSCEPADGPPFAYTVGLFGMAHPELLIFGLDPSSSARILNHLARRVRDGEHLMPGRMLDFSDRPHRIVCETVPNPGEIVFEANRFSVRPDDLSVPMLQLSYDDAGGRFPWEEGYSAPEMQPRPGTFRA